MNEGREAVLVPEKKEKIEALKRKYKNASMTDDTAQKIRRLEITNNILKAATGIVGVATVVNYFIPDPVPFLDEAVLTGATALLGSASAIVDNKIKDLAVSGSTDVKMEEVNELVNGLSNIAKKKKEKTQTPPTEGMTM